MKKINNDNTFEGLAIAAMALAATVSDVCGHHRLAVNAGIVTVLLTLDFIRRNTPISS